LVSLPYPTPSGFVLATALIKTQKSDITFGYRGKDKQSFALQLGACGEPQCEGDGDGEGKEEGDGEGCVAMSPSYRNFLRFHPNTLKH